MKPTAKFLPDGQRLHLQHGPSDLVVWAEGGRDDAYRAAIQRFETIIAEIVEELGVLRQPLSPQTMPPRGGVARRMHDACCPFVDTGYLTRMAAVAGAIADEVLSAIVAAASPRRAYVNNGGDIALRLSPGTSFKTAIKGHDGADLGRIEIAAGDGVGGIATSGCHGRSFSLGVADSVTVLAGCAAQADVAATLIANAVDLPGHLAISRCMACDLDDASDLAEHPVVVGCGSLSEKEREDALAAGLARAQCFQQQGLIRAAGLFLQGGSMTTQTSQIMPNRELTYANA